MVRSLLGADGPVVTNKYLLAVHRRMQIGDEGIPQMLEGELEQ